MLTGACRAGPGRAGAGVAAVICLWGAGLAWPGSGAIAQAASHTKPTADAPAVDTHSSGPARAPDRPPLATGLGTGTSTAGATEEASASASASGGEPLAGNGLNSPLCRDGDEADLSASAERDCRATGFEAAQAPSGDYAFDVHINAGVAHAGNYFAVGIQDLVKLGWIALVALVHALIVLLDWCFTLDLLDSQAMSGVGSALRATQATFTQPWLALVLAIAAVAALYHGLIRRRVAQTIGEALLTIAMMAGGLWVIMNPTGTIGALGAWANEASLGTLGAVTAGTPAHPERTLAESNGYVFSSAIESPWCYLEFGNVSWCENPARLDSRLHAAALQIAAKGGSDAPSPSPELLRAARTNGQLFLALPANGPARNSINDEWSLLHVLCGGGEEPCQGPTAAEAQARMLSGTDARMIGVAFIAIGLSGMILLLGAIALQLLRAAIVSLICLLLTPAAVLAPALGEGGRGAFRTWATRLLGAVTSKLVFAFLLGAVLESERVVASVRLGWWTQWVLISAMWWIGFLHRHKLLDFAHGAHRGAGGAGAAGVGGHRQSLAQRAREALDTPRSALRHMGRAKRKLATPAPSVQRQSKLERAGREHAQALAGAQVAASLESEVGEARTLLEAEPEVQQALAAKRASLERLQDRHADARSQAQAAGEARKAALVDPTLSAPLERARAVAEHAAEERSHRQEAIRLRGRMDRVQGEIDSEQGALNTARRTVGEADRAMQATGKPYTRAREQERARFLDAQAALPRHERDYGALAGLAKYGRKQFEALDEPSKRQARLAIDRELARRKELDGAVAGVAAGVGGDEPGWRERHKAGKQVDRRLEEMLRAEGHRPARGGGESALERWKRDGAAAEGAAGGEGKGGGRGRSDAGGGGGNAGAAHARRRRSPVLEDAREVQERRKRQLGRDRR